MGRDRPAGDALRLVQPGKKGFGRQQSDTAEGCRNIQQHRAGGRQAVRQSLPPPQHTPNVVCWTPPDLLFIAFGGLAAYSPSRDTTTTQAGSFLRGGSLARLGRKEGMAGGRAALLFCCVLRLLLQRPADSRRAAACKVSKGKTNVGRMKAYSIALVAEGKARPARSALLQEQQQLLLLRRRRRRSPWCGIVTATKRTAGGGGSSQRDLNRNGPGAWAGGRARWAVSLDRRLALGLGAGGGGGRLVALLCLRSDPD